MEDLYLEMLERLEYLQEQIETDEIKWRKAECTLAIVRVQQLLLSNLNSKKPKRNINSNIITTISRWYERMFCKHIEKIEIYRCYQDRYISNVCCSCGKVVYSDL